MMYSKVVLPIDIHDQNSWVKAVPAALKICQTFAAELHVLYVLPALNASVSAYVTEAISRDALRSKLEQELTELVQQFDAGDIPLFEAIIDGSSIHQSILTFQKNIEADLIVMNSHHPQASDYLLGPNSAHVVRHAHCSVFVVRD